MLLSNSAEALTQILSKSLQEALKTSLKRPDWEMVIEKNLAAIKKKEFIMATISSCVFRCVVIVHFSKDDEFLNNIARALEISVDELGEQHFYDYISEVGNLVCGAVKRGLSPSTTYLGMSIPSQLVAESLVYLEDAKFDFDTHITASNDNTTVCSSIYMYTFGDITIQLPADNINDDDAVEAGELELF